MLDIKFIRENPKLLQKACKDKNFLVDIDKLLELDAFITTKQRELESLQLERNQKSKQIPQVSPQEREVLKDEVTEIKKQMGDLEGPLREKKEEFDELMLYVPQPAREDVPVGKDDSDNVEIMTYGKIREFDFEPKDHITLGKDLDIIDFERGAKLSGSRSYVLKKEGTMLEHAVLQFAMDLLEERGFTPMSVPILVNEDVMKGTGYFPLGRDQAYCVEKDNMALIGTSEVPLCSYHADEILDESVLPLRYMAKTACFRREAGTYGKDTKGLYRVHQFNKVEMVVIARHDKEESERLHEEILKNAEDLLKALELPYRKVYVCTGDLGQGQVRKHDLETWMPSRKAYSETHSCSTFYDYQSRRLKMRYKDKEDGKNKLTYTLNNTACATPRILIPLLENHQEKDGRVRIPECLRKYMGGRTHIG
jgi:seryl-tRNA synthetase